MSRLHEGWQHLCGARSHESCHECADLQAQLRQAKEAVEMMAAALENISYKESEDGDWLLLDNVMLNVIHRGPLVKQNIKKHCRKIEAALSHPTVQAARAK
jgi:hypothetical protein